MLYTIHFTVGVNRVFNWIYILQQESIPVGCAPSAAVTVVGGGVSARGCVLAQGGGVPGQEGVPAWGDVPAWGCACPERVYLPGGRGVCIPACTEADPPPVNRMTDRRL